MGGGGKNSIPKGWVGCPKIGIGIINDTFVAFKTPLRHEINRKVQPSESFTPGDVMNQIHSLKSQPLPLLWVDLTSTDRYYEADWVSKSDRCTYVKMPAQGHGIVPSRHMRLDFISQIDDFLRAHPGGLVAVHCTHGFNRTGFMICSYLIERKGFNPYDALMEFKKFRPPGIYREEYVTGLYTLWRNLVYKHPEKGQISVLPPPQVESPSWLASDALKTHRFRRGDYSQRDFGSSSGSTSRASNYAERSSYRSYGSGYGPKPSFPPCRNCGVSGCIWPERCRPRRDFNF